MYLATVQAPSRSRGGAGPVPATVVGLGVVSMVTDMSTEMVTSILPLYLVYGVGIGLWQLGAMDALYLAATALLRLLGGWTADRLGRPKTVAAVGYGLSTLSRLGLPAAGSSAIGIGVAIGVDRAGKGIRTAPRDAMIASAGPTGSLGRSFGVHRALDTTGALLGPIIAFALIASVGSGGFDVVFTASFCLGLVGLLVLLFFVNVPPNPVPARSPRAGLGQLKASAGPGRVRRASVLAAMCGVMTAGDMLLYVAVQRELGLPAEMLPLLPLGTAVTFMLAAAPVGRLADRVGRRRTFLIGHLILATAYLTVALGPGGWPVAGVVLGLHGLFYAATDGVLMAYTVAELRSGVAGAELRSGVAGTELRSGVAGAELRSGVADSELRSGSTDGQPGATGLAVVQTVQALARAGGAVVAGILAATAGLGLSFTLAAVVLTAIVLITLSKRERR